MASNWLFDIEDRIKRRVPALAENANQDLLDDLINDAFVAIVDYANANSYETKWDNTLILCVITMYNYMGNEASLSRNANGLSDSYPSIDIISPIIQGRITQYIRPVGYNYSASRFTQPQ